MLRIAILTKYKLSGFHWGSPTSFSTLAYNKLHHADSRTSHSALPSYHFTHHRFIGGILILCPSLLFWRIHLHLGTGFPSLRPLPSHFASPFPNVPLWAIYHSSLISPRSSDTTPPATPIPLTPLAFLSDSSSTTQAWRLRDTPLRLPDLEREI